MPILFPLLPTLLSTLPALLSAGPARSLDDGTAALERAAIERPAIERLAEKPACEEKVVAGSAEYLDWVIAESSE